MLRIDARRSGFESVGVDECRETASLLRVTKERLAPTGSASLLTRSRRSSRTAPLKRLAQADPLSASSALSYVVKRLETVDGGLERTDCVRVASRPQQSMDLGFLQQPEPDCDVVILDVVKIGTSGEQPTRPNDELEDRAPCRGQEVLDLVHPSKDAQQAGRSQS